jgi:hypothetical protein
VAGVERVALNGVVREHIPQLSLDRGDPSLRRRLDTVRTNERDRAPPAELATFIVLVLSHISRERWFMGVVRGQSVRCLVWCVVWCAVE